MARAQRCAVQRAAVEILCSIAAPWPMARTSFGGKALHKRTEVCKQYQSVRTSACRYALMCEKECGWSIISLWASSPRDSSDDNVFVRRRTSTQAFEGQSRSDVVCGSVGLLKPTVATSQIFSVDARGNNLYFHGRLALKSSRSCMQKTILVVDDDPLYVELVKDLLDLHHYQVCTALNGLDALRILEQQKVDAVVSDIEMPQMNGIAFHRKIIEQENLRGVPFIFLTGSEEAHYFQYVNQDRTVHLVRKTEMVEKLVPLIQVLTFSEQR